MTLVCRQCVSAWGRVLLLAAVPLQPSRHARTHVPARVQQLQPPAAAPPQPSRARAVLQPLQEALVCVVVTGPAHCHWLLPGVWHSPSKALKSVSQEDAQAAGCNGPQGAELVCATDSSNRWGCSRGQQQSDCRFRSGGGGTRLAARRARLWRRLQGYYSGAHFTPGSRAAT